MTFYIDGNGGGDNSARQVGGLVVSDIVLGMDTNFVFCQPDVVNTGNGRKQLVIAWLNG